MSRFKSIGKPKSSSKFQSDSNPFVRILGRKNVQRVQKYVSVASEVADAVILLRDKPRASDYVSLGLKLVQSISEENSTNIWAYFHQGWDDLSDWGFAEDLIEIVANKHSSEEVAGNDSYQIHGCDADNEDIGWGIESDVKHGPYIRTDRHTETLAVIGRAVWEHYGPAIELVGAGYQGSKAEANSHAGCHLHQDESRKEEVLSSKLAKDILSRINLFKGKGYNRSIMLVGPPGTGKTSIMKFIAKELGLYSLRINAGEMSSIHPRDIVRAVEILQPTLLMIDDFDRFERATSMLSELEQVNRSVKVFMVTCNSTEDLDPAVLRPGRYDEIIEVIGIDPNIVDKLLGDVPEELRAAMSKWPVAFIEEYKKRSEVLGPEGAYNELNEFQSRVNSIYEQYVEQDTKKSIKTLGGKK